MINTLTKTVIIYTFCCTMHTYSMAEKSQLKLKQSMQSQKLRATSAQKLLNSLQEKIEGCTRPELVRALNITERDIQFTNHVLNTLSMAMNCHPYIAFTDAEDLILQADYSLSYLEKNLLRIKRKILASYY